MTPSRFVAAALTLGLATVAGAQAPTSPPSPLLDLPSLATAAFVDVSVVPMDRERVLDHQTVVVRDGRIVSLGPVRSTLVPKGALRIDGRGKYLAPGLVDMHAHMAPGAESLADPAGRQLALYLATGVTTIRSLSSPPSALPGQLALRGRIAAGQVLGPRLVLAGQSVNGRSAATPADAARMVREQKVAGFDLIKTHGMFASREAYDSMAAAAKAAGLPLVGHVTPEYGLARAMEAGQQVEHLDGYIAAMVPPGTAVDPGQFILDTTVLRLADSARIAAVARETVRRGIWNGPTLALFETIASDETPEALDGRPEMRYVPAAAHGAWKKQKADAVAEMPAEGRRQFVLVRRRLVLALHDAGAKLLAGSDSPQFFMTPGYGLHRELDALAAAGLTPYAVLETATRNPAEWLGRAREAGTVAPGRWADLVLLDANPLADVANVHRVSGVMVAGRWLDSARLASLRDAVAVAAAAVPVAPPAS